MASWPDPPLRSAFAKTAAAGATDAAAPAAAGGEDATATACPTAARAAVRVRTEAAPRRHDSAEGLGARRARARARGAAGQAGTREGGGDWRRLLGGDARGASRAGAGGDARLLAGPRLKAGALAGAPHGHQV